jgi:hypothetical protein
MKFPMVDKYLGLTIYHDVNQNHYSVDAQRLESALMRGKSAFGCGNLETGSLMYGPTIQHDDKKPQWEIRALVLGVEKLNKPTVKELADEVKALMNRENMPASLDYFLSKVEGLLTEVLK